MIRVSVEHDSVVHIATAAKHSHIIDESWELVPDCSFHYTDGGRTRMAVYRRHCRAGETVTVPQGNWTGGILLAPKLVMTREIEVIYPPPPGVVIDRSPAPQRVYVGSPSLAILPDGSYVASHDWFGPGTAFDTTAVLGSGDRGRSWTRLAEIKGQFWSTLFVQRDALYIIGADARYGRAVIRRSVDGGRTWTAADTPTTGLLLPEASYHCAPVPVLRHAGRLWRAMEDRFGTEGWGRHFRAFVMSAPEDADLLDAASWTFSNRLPFDRSWRDAPKVGWLEGNVAVAPGGRLVNILRFECPEGGTAAVLGVSDDGTKVSFDPAAGFVRFPGGRHKFTIRFDPVSKRYWSLVNKGKNPQAFRNVLALTSSSDLRAWRVDSVLLMHPDSGNHAWQYVDWQIDGDDIVAVSRTAWGDSYNAHDANCMTFHRVCDFRTDARTVE